MLTISGSTRILMYEGNVDMRKSFEGLSFLTQQAFPDQLLSGDLFVFLNKRCDRIKVLYWDKDGLAIWYKRLEKGTFSPEKHHHQPMTRRDFLMLLEGVIPKRVQKRWNSD